MIREGEIKHSKIWMRTNTCNNLGQNQNGMCGTSHGLHIHKECLSSDLGSIMVKLSFVVCNPVQGIPQFRER